MKDESNPLLSADFDNGSVLTYLRSAINQQQHREPMTAELGWYYEQYY
jgi:hypothetical protein